MTRSHRLKMTSMSCSIRKNVLPVPRRLSIRERILRLSVGFTPATGSSSRMSDGSITRTLASSKSFFWPPERIGPASGAYVPITRLKRVASPAPFGPIRPTMLPASTRMLHSSTAWIPPNAFETRSTARRSTTSAAPDEDSRLLRCLERLRKESRGAEQDEKVEQNPECHEPDVEDPDAPIGG